MTRRSRAFLVLPALLLLAGCGHSLPTRFFTLDPVAPLETPGAAYRGPSVLIGAVRLPPIFDRLEVARETAPNSVEVNDFARWAAAPGSLAQRALGQDLASRLPAGVVLFSRSAPPAAWKLQVEVVAIGSRDGLATMDVQWTLLSTGPDAHVLTNRFERISRPQREGRDDVQMDLSGLLGTLSDRIVAALLSTALTDGAPPVGKAPNENARSAPRAP